MLNTFSISIQFKYIYCWHYDIKLYILEKFVLTADYKQDFLRYRWFIYLFIKLLNIFSNLFYGSNLSL